MKCTMTTPEKPITADEVGYGVPVGLEDGTPAYAVVFPKNGAHDDVRLVLKTSEVNVTDGTTAGEEVYNAPPADHTSKMR